MFYVTTTFKSSATVYVESFALWRKNTIFYRHVCIRRLLTLSCFFLTRLHDATCIHTRTRPINLADVTPPSKSVYSRFIDSSLVVPFHRQLFFPTLSTLLFFLFRRQNTFSYFIDKFVNKQLQILMKKGAFTEGNK